MSLPGKLTRLKNGSVFTTPVAFVAVNLRIWFTSSREEPLVCDVSASRFRSALNSFLEYDDAIAFDIIAGSTLADNHAGGTGTENGKINLVQWENGYIFNNKKMLWSEKQRR